MEENTVVTNDNQGAPAQGQDVQNTQVPEQSPQPQTSAENQEFNESWTPEMQAVWTKKSTELKQQIEKERADFNTEREQLLKKANVYDSIEKDARAMEALRKLYSNEVEEKPKEVEIPQITKEDIELAQHDPDAQARLLEKLDQRNEARLKVLENKLNMTSEELAHTRLVNTIVDFSREAKNWDDLEGAGLIEPMLQKYKTAYPKATEMQIVEAAYRDAKKVWDSVNAQAEAKYKEQAQKVISEKKIASGETGTSSNVPLKPIEGKNWREVWSKGADEIGLR